MSPSDDLTSGCPSFGKTPIRCNNKKEYFDQFRIFHPDKNINCIENSTLKSQLLGELCTPKGGKSNRKRKLRNRKTKRNRK
jgi:hypothetical protein